MSQRILFRTISLSPPFHRATAGPTSTEWCSGRRGDQATENARLPHPGGRTPRLSRTTAKRAWGSPWVWREPPENWVVGCETSRGKNETHAADFQFPTIHANTLQNLLHFDDEPYEKDKEMWSDCDGTVTYLDERQVSLAQCGRNDQDTPTSPPHTSGT